MFERPGILPQQSGGPSFVYTLPVAFSLVAAVLAGGQAASGWEMAAIVSLAPIFLWISFVDGRSYIVPDWCVAVTAGLAVVPHAVAWSNASKLAIANWSKNWETYPKIQKIGLIRQGLEPRQIAQTTEMGRFCGLANECEVKYRVVDIVLGVLFANLSH